MIVNSKTWSEFKCDDPLKLLYGTTERCTLQELNNIIDDYSGVLFHKPTLFYILAHRLIMRFKIVLKLNENDSKPTQVQDDTIILLDHNKSMTAFWNSDAGMMEKTLKYDEIHVVSYRILFAHADLDI